MQDFRIFDLTSRCVGAAMVTVFFSIPTAAVADRYEKILSPHLDFSVVCLEDPEEDGWTDVSHFPPSVSSARYGLLVNLAEEPSGPLPFSIEPYKYRLTVGAFPCFYEYLSHEYRGYGTALDVTAPMTDVEIDGMKFPRILDDSIVIPVIKGLIEECKRSSFSWPYTHLFQSCERQVSDVLVAETTAISIHYDPRRPKISATILFIRGLPYLDGKPLLEF